MVWMEVIDDVAREAGRNWNQAQIDHIKRVMALHEVGRQFGLALWRHDPGFGEHVMQVHNNDPNDPGEPGLPNWATDFRDEDIDRIRDHGTGAKSPP